MTATLLLLVAAGLATAQSDVRIYTQPMPPAFDVLNRVDLATHWRAQVPTRGKRDGLFSVQVIPWKENPQILVQTIAGAVLLYDAETGDRIWETMVGSLYQDAQPPGWNEHSIMTTRREVLHVLNRETGFQRVYSLDPNSKQPHYGFPLLSVPSAAPAVAEYNPKRPEQTKVFMVFDGRVVAYSMPDFALVDRLQKAANASKPGAGPRAEYRLKFEWSYLTADMHFEQPPLWTIDQVGVVSTDGRFLSLTPDVRGLRYEYHFRKDVVAPMGQHGNIAYIGSLDFNLYAFNMASRFGSILWRFSSGAPIRRKPAVTDDHVYVTSHREGMNCLDRDTGTSEWLNPDAERFVSASPKYVYVVDRVGHLLILDQLRGRTLARLPLRDYNVPVTNELTDRLYFASHDGQILCLRHRNHQVPATMKTWRKLEPEAPMPPMPQPAAAMP